MWMRNTQHLNLCIDGRMVAHLHSPNGKFAVQIHTILTYFICILYILYLVKFLIQVRIFCLLPSIVLNWLVRMVSPERFIGMRKYGYFFSALSKVNIIFRKQEIETSLNSNREIFDWGSMQSAYYDWFEPLVIHTIHRLNSWTIIPSVEIILRYYKVSDRLWMRSMVLSSWDINY